MTLCASLSLHPCVLRIRYPGPRHKKRSSPSPRCMKTKMTLHLLSNRADLTLQLKVGLEDEFVLLVCSIYFTYLFNSWLAQLNVSECVCVCVCAFVCLQREKGELYQVADMFSLHWVPWLRTIASAVCSCSPGALVSSELEQDPASIYSPRTQLQHRGTLSAAFLIKDPGSTLCAR